MIPPQAVDPNVLKTVRDVPAFKPDGAFEHEEPTPPSGIRRSSPGMAPLTYRVYTLAEIDASADARVRSTTHITRISPWTTTSKAAQNVVWAFWNWARSPAPRLRFADALRLPMTTLLVELRTALHTLDWKRVAVYGAAGLGTLFVLLFAVITAAELTDDLKAPRTASTSQVTPSGDPVSANNPAETNVVAAAADAVAVAAPQAPVEESIELDDGPTRPAQAQAQTPRPARPRAAAKAPPAPRAKTTAKSAKGLELFSP